MCGKQVFAVLPDMADHGSACLPQDPTTNRAMVPRNTDANIDLTTRASIETATSGSALTLSSSPDQAVGRRSPSWSCGRRASQRLRYAASPR